MLLSFANFAGWREHSSHNCYKEKGGVPVIRRDPPHKHMTLEECQAACEVHAKSKPWSPCMAVVVQSVPGFDGQNCWLRSAIHLAMFSTVAAAFTRAGATFAVSVAAIALDVAAFAAVA